MQITYDAEVDALYIKLRDGTARTERLDADVAIDFDNEGLVTGIEILAASERVFGESRSVNFSYLMPDTRVVDSASVDTLPAVSPNA
jgi:uncharacterized protein YuzE